MNPHAGALAEARRGVAAGAVGIKLHPRAEQFALHDPVVEEVVALAGERRLPVIIHAGRGIPALGQDAVELARRHPGARLLVAIAEAANAEAAGLAAIAPPALGAAIVAGTPSVGAPPN